MTKIAIVVHRTESAPKVVFHGTNDEALKFYRSFNQPGETTLFYCRAAERTKKTSPVPVTIEPAKPARKPKVDGLL